MSFTKLLRQAGALAAAVAFSSCGGGGGDLPPLDFWSQMGLAVADFNGDGRPDLALVDTHVNRPPPQDSFVEVYLQEGAGMSVPAVYPVAADSWSLAAADLDGDGRMDLVATSISTVPPKINQPSDAGAVAVLLADASSPGRFLSPRIVPTGGHPQETVAIRIGASPLLSLVQPGPSGGLRIFSQVSQGEFGSPMDVGSAAGLSVTHLAVADIDADGMQDLAVATSTSVYWLRQNAGGGFDAPQWVGGGGISVSSLVAADLDGDGRIDLVASDAGHTPEGNLGGSAVMVIRQAGGAFDSARIPVADGAQHVAVGDLDGDGIPDIVVASQIYQSMTAWHGVTILHQWPAARGTFAPAGSYPGPFVGVFVAVVDVNGDGRNDIVVNDGPSVLLQSASAPGSFEAYRPIR